MSSRSVAGVVAGVVAAVWVVLYPPLMWRLMHMVDGVNDAV